MRVAFYKGTQPGLPGLYNRLVRAKERGPYSHCEAIFSDGLAASASFMDGGVRFKAINFNKDRWDFVEVPNSLEPSIRAWFRQHDGDKYDLAGNLFQAVGFVKPTPGREFCSAALAAAFGISEPWRYGPNVLFATLFFYFKSLQTPER